MALVSVEGFIDQFEKLPLSDEDFHQLIHTSIKLVSLITRESLDPDYLRRIGHRNHAQ